MTTTWAVTILEEHSFEHKMIDGRLHALEHFTINQKPGEEWVDVSSMSMKELYLWIGY